MQARTTIRPAGPADDAARDEFVRAHPEGTFFHLTGWRNVIQRHMGHESRDLLAFQGEQLVGVLPLMNCRGLFGGRQLISMPYAVYGGPLGLAAEIDRELVQHAEQIAVREQAGRLELRCLTDPKLELLGSELYYTFIRELPGEVDEVLARMPKKARAEARKARDKHGLELSEGIWFLDDLIRLFHRNKRALGSPGLPVEYFRGLPQEFGDRVAVHLVRRGSEPLAAVLSFLYEDTILAYYSGTAEGADRAYSASNFMYLGLQEWAVEHGYRKFDFGRSRKDAGAFGFKVRQGFEPQPLHYRYRLVRDKGLPSLTPSNPRTKVLRDTWSRLPLWLTTRLSKRAARYLP
ncbi:MAG: FemAB-related protein (PEP-CTERM system-associated) [Chlamydiales bacterium]|jgi:FemAB-related protein (PEP-CTERM system-associated)